MSVQKEAKLKQNYQLESKRCSNCANFNSDFVKESLSYGDYYKERNKRCSIGDFVVKKTAVCDLHAFKK